MSIAFRIFVVGFVLVMFTACNDSSELEIENQALSEQVDSLMTALDQQKQSFSFQTVRPLLLPMKAADTLGSKLNYAILLQAATMVREGRALDFKIEAFSKADNSFEILNRNGLDILSIDSDLANEDTIRLKLFYFDPDSLVPGFVFETDLELN
ncbi:hypothetical protein [Croceimicrobium hydrocarbonivorans]|uniref:Uncharacterized protein n=1 Tax=Croceimicrobium hydrocarbonivorans TaxID=2761580 RepID=A0A7H0VAR0_9FLAO|nr:hypothetical protein [Croceimicrobium hydrocarbonivorans]QNR22808.1 hypothetical protein H4K34_10490 [Croceimicrobium hydrocarbonivorans]